MLYYNDYWLTISIYYASGNSDAEEAEAEQLYEDLQDFLELTPSRHERKRVYSEVTQIIRTQHRRLDGGRFGQLWCKQRQRRSETFLRNSREAYRAGATSSEV